MPVEKIKKRDGRVVEFDRNLIARAIEKACGATGVGIGGDVVGSIADDVVDTLEASFPQQIPGVEDVQDFVERKLAEHGLFDVAKAYILYRKDHEAARAVEQKTLLTKLTHHEITVQKRDGTTAPFDVKEIARVVRAVAHDYGDAVDVRAVVEDSKTNMYDGITTAEINRAIVMSLSARIERDPVYSSVAARFLFNDLYRDVLGCYEFDEKFLDTYHSHLVVQTEKGIACGRLDERMRGFDFEKLTAALAPERDRLFQYLGAQTLYDRYFLYDYKKNCLEVPQYFWMRVAMGLALEEDDPTARAIEFYDVMSQLHYVPSSPTLFHAGTSHPQMSSCYLTYVVDDLEHIFKCIGDNAQLSKWAGGVANDWTAIRGTGALIKSTNTVSQGVVPFLNIVDSVTAAINRSGRRRGATCVYLETWHYDIEAFLELRKNTGDERRRTHDTNTANWIPDLFMKRVAADEEWTLFSTHETPDLHELYGKEFEKAYEAYERQADRGELEVWKRVRAKDLWRKMVTMLFETGHPWMTFKDPCNVRSPQDHVGVVHSSNLCTEITLNTSREETAVCNLGSVNLPRHVTSGALDRVGLSRTIRTAMRMLDNVIDINFYPTEEAKRSNLRHRPVGLGLMGLQDALYLLGMNFDSEEAVQFSDESMEFISYHAILASSELAKERGAYESYKGSKWDRDIFPVDTVKLLEEERGVSTEVDLSARMDWEPVRRHVKEHGMRNSNCMAIAPTATNANINGCLPSIEPIYKNVYTKSNICGEFTVINKYLVDDLRALNLWNDEMLEKLKYYDGSVQRIAEVPAALKEKYKEVFEIDPEWLVRHAAYRGKWIDQSQSLNIFTSSKSGKLISDVYMLAWKLGLKTTYYMRTLGASAIEKSTIDINKQYESVPAAETVAVAAVARGDVPQAELVLNPSDRTRVSVRPAPASASVEVVGEVCESCEG